MMCPRTTSRALFGICALLLVTPIGSAAPPVGTSAATALETIFNPVRAPEKRTMGLVQRSFLELIEQANSHLQIAIVIDGTDSMADELAGVQQRMTALVEDLRRYRGDAVEFSIVIFRDSGSPSGEIQLPLAGFSRDTEAVRAAIAKLEPEQGAPYFHELVDVGLYVALDQLPWSTAPESTKWILLVGDAPPYAPTFRNPQHPKARRRYATELLVDLARRKGVRINSILCVSDEEVVEPYDAALAETRAFMNELAAGTDGLMLDLSYPDIRSALIAASKTPRLEYGEIGRITQEELDAIQSRIVGVRDRGAHEAGPVRVAVVPHLPLERMSFDPRLPAVTVATAIRSKLASLPGVKVQSSVDVQRQLRRLEREGLPSDARLQALAARLGVDYVVWGEGPAETTIRSAMYRRQDGEAVTQISFDGRVEKVAGVLLKSVSGQDSSPIRLASLLDTAEAQQRLEAELAGDKATAGEILSAIESLEQALAHTAGSPTALTMLETAHRFATSAAEAERRNPLPHWLLANTEYNLAQADLQRGDRESAQRRMVAMAIALRRAFRGKEAIVRSDLQREIEADYHLLVEKDWSKAATLYKQLADDATASLETRKRAHWMLAGIYSGDWNVADDAVDPEKARRHTIAILGAWPESPEAEALRRWLRWDDTTGATQFDYLPRVAGPLAESIPAELPDVEA